MKIYIFILFLAAFCAFSGCRSKEPVIIGYSANLTGRQSELGVTGRNGIEMAVDEINSQGGINGRLIKLIVKDDKNKTDESAEG